MDSRGRCFFLRWPFLRPLLLSCSWPLPHKAISIAILSEIAISIDFPNVLKGRPKAAAPINLPDSEEIQRDGKKSRAAD